MIKKESSYLKCWDVNNFYGWALSQKFPVNEFKWVKEIAEFKESYIKSCNEERNGGYFLEVDIRH